MSGGVHHHFRTESANRVAGCVELREWRKRGVRAAVTVGRFHAGKMNPRCPHVGGGNFHASKIVIDSSRKRPNVSIAKMPADHRDSKQLHFMARRSCCKVVLKSLQIDGNVRGEVSASRCEERLPLCRIHGGKSLWHDGILK